MYALGYTYSGGYALCTRHATDTRDEGNESGQAFPIFSDSEMHVDLVCDVEGCGIILARNCIDGCGTGPHTHTLFYDDHDEVWQAQDRLARECDLSGEVETLHSQDYAYAITFTTDGEYSLEQADYVLRVADPDDYDLNAQC
jgi:hypothetical protein